MAHWKPFSLKDIIEKIEEQKIVLPVVQRNLVWEEEQITLIFDTLLRGNSFGGIMTIEDSKEKKPLFAYRKFIKDYIKNKPNTSISDKLSKDIEYVIDGQQRLSAFYIGITGTYEGKRLYFNLLSDYENKRFDFQFAEEKKKLPREVDKIDSEEKTEALWKLVAELFTGIIDAGNNYKGYFRNNSELRDHGQGETIKENLEIFQQQTINTENIGIAKVQSDRTKDTKIIRNEVVELFRRLNQGGTRLDALELVASQLKAFNPENEKFLYDIQGDKHFEEVGFGQDEVLKLVFLLQGDSQKGIADISEKDAEFIQSNKEKIKKTVETLSKYPKLKESNIPNVPKYFIAYHLFYRENNEAYFDHTDTKSDDFKLLDRWLKISLINRSVFSRSGAGWQGDITGVRKILEVMKQNHNKPFPYEALIEVYKSYPLHSFQEKINEENINNMNIGFIFSLLYGREIKNRRNDRDHIQPSSLLKNNYDWNLINDIGNLELLHSSTNRGAKSDREFSEWVNDKSCVEDKATFIKKHFIPEDEVLWKIVNFEAFLTERRKLIAAKINELLSS